MIMHFDLVDNEKKPYSTYHQKHTYNYVSLVMCELAFFLPANRLSNFIIGMSESCSGAPVVGGYKELARETGALGAGQTKTYKVQGTGGCLIVQLLGKNYLTLCEVVVMGSKS